MKHPFLSCTIAGLLLLLGATAQGQEQLLRKMIKSKPVQAKTTTRGIISKSIPVADNGSAPTITKVEKLVGGKGSVITLTGTNFNQNTTVTIGNKPIKQVHVLSATSIQIKLEDEVSGKVAVTGNGTTAQFSTDFTWVKAPVITEISKKKFATGDKITITGENFVDGTRVWIDGVEQTSVTITDETELTLTVEGPAAKGLIEMESDGGETTYGGSTPFDAAANITLPLQGQGINIIPTPTFNFTQVHGNSNFAFRLGVWGNTLGTDSSLKKVVNNLLVPQISLFGFKADGLLRLNDLDQKWGIAAAFQLNVLLKKVSYYDTSSKDISSLNPFVLHPKVGLTATFFDNYVFIGGYLNMFSVVTENEEFKNFFGSKKSTFVYPNFNLGGIFDFEGGKQSIKVELDLVIHNGETRMLLPTKDKVIPYLKVALLSDL